MKDNKFLVFIYKFKRCSLQSYCVKKRDTMRLLLLLLLNVLTLYYCHLGHAAPYNEDHSSLADSKLELIEDFIDELEEGDYDEEYDTDDPYPEDIVTGEYLNEIRFQDEDGIWRTINLNDTLDPDYLYDYENLTWVDEPEYDMVDIGGDNNNLLQNRLATTPLSISDNVIPSLYSKDDPDTAYNLNTVNGRDAPFDINHPTKVVVHGWLENGGKMWVNRLKDKYFINGYHNVVLVDWQKYALLEYTFAARKTRKIGAYVGQVLISLILAEKIRIEDIHIVGHSLGAHIAGIAAKTIEKQLGKKVGRITGLDPAGPMFEKPLLVRKKKRLVKEDAEFVDIIHTCGGLLGFKRAIGHADFFPNGGKNIQPGCGVLKNAICSHARGYKFFTESVNSERFVSTPCGSWKKYKKGKCDDGVKVSMGYYLDTTIASGKYYLRTKKRSPYAKG